MPTTMLALRMEVSISVNSPVIRKGREGSLRSETKGIQSIHTTKIIQKSILKVTKLLILGDLQTKHQERNTIC